jgi:hypothetical protein
VPDFYKAPLTMSGITMTSARRALRRRSSPKDSFAQMLPAPRSTSREFARGEVIALLRRVLRERAERASAQLRHQLTIRAEDGRVVFEDREERSSTDLQGSRPAASAIQPLVHVGVRAGHLRAARRRTLPPGGDAGIGRDVMIRIR